MFAVSFALFSVSQILPTDVKLAENTEKHPHVRTQAKPLQSRGRHLERGWEGTEPAACAATPGAARFTKAMELPHVRGCQRHGDS